MVGHRPWVRQGGLVWLYLYRSHIHHWYILLLRLHGIKFTRSFIELHLLPFVRILFMCFRVELAETVEYKITIALVQLKEVAELEFVYEYLGSQLFVNGPDVLQTPYEIQFQLWGLGEAYSWRGG